MDALTDLSTDGTVVTDSTVVPDADDGGDTPTPTDADGGLDATPAALPALAGGTSFGFTLGSAGDVNGDGFGDVVVSTRASCFAVYFGSASGLGSTPFVPSASLRGVA